MQWVVLALEQITQGSIVDGVDWGLGEENPLSIVLSNACDIENGKCSFLIVLALLPAQEILSDTKEYKEKVSMANAKFEIAGKAWKSFCSYLEAFIYNRNVCRYYFFDPQPVVDAPPFVVDFQMIKSMDYSEIGVLENLGQLCSPFVEQMVMHFAGYVSRIPSDRVEESQKEEYIRELAGKYRRSVG